MRFSALRVAGFRGIRGRLELTFPSGFMVVSGRNGTGKSSICDAIEFALTGSLTKYSDSSEKGEGVEDYLWWRGAPVAEEKFVSLELMDSSGAKSTITRRPEGTVIDGEPDLLNRLCDTTIDAEKTVADICRTSIIRDEFITRLSVDLAEPERFAFVRAAVGSTSFAGAESKLTTARKVLETRILRSKHEYDRARDRVKALVTELSKAHAEAARGEDAAEAEKAIREWTGQPLGDLTELLTAGRKLPAEIRLRIDALDRLVGRIERLVRQETEISGPALRERLETLLRNIETNSSALGAAEQELAGVEARLQQIQQEDGSLASLAQLREHGSRLGRKDGRCPLCRSSISEENFRDHLAELERSIQETSAIASELARRRAAISEVQQQLNLRIASARRQRDQITATLEAANRERGSIAQEYSRLGIDSDEVSSVLAEQLRAAAVRDRDHLAAVERSIAVLEASRAHGRVAEIQRELAAAQQAVVYAERLVNKQERADQRVKQASATLKRVASEIVDDRLAAIRPLLAELYVRLRPHVDWPEITYLIRGDTRRFLSLRVGSGLNLRFMFSSGQRRAAGLAFLMAVSLSRPWCRLESLMFDDPVQHIDDFRALHLVECLAALRQSGKQIICTVEESALAELLARRLRSSEAAEGGMVEMDYESGRGAFIKRLSAIVPFTDQVLRSA